MAKIDEISTNSDRTLEDENIASNACETKESLQSLMKEIALESIDGPKRALVDFSPNAEGTVGDRYRFRAECQRDAELFVRTIEGFIESSCTTQPQTDYPDVNVTFSIKREISPRDLLWIACSIGDGHVLVQTLEKEDKYTGRRVYFRVLDVNAVAYKPSADVLKDMKKGAAHHITNLKYLLAGAREFAENLRAISA